MVYNDVKLKLPKLPTVKLGDLCKGKMFMFARDHYAESVPVYMVLKNDYEKTVNVVNLQDGETRNYGSNYLVVELEVTLVCEPLDQNKLPF